MNVNAETSKAKIRLATNRPKSGKRNKKYIYGDKIKVTESIDTEKKRGHAMKAQGPGFWTSVLPKSGHSCEPEQIH